MLLVQKWPFFQFFFNAIQARKMSFKKFQNEKAPFYATKSRSSQIRKSDIFPKGLTRGMGQKLPFFNLFFFLGNIGKENVFNDILERKKLFYAIKTISSKSRKTDIFFKGINPWFWSKNGHFSNFFFRQYRARKCLLRYSRTKKRLSRL